MGFIISSALVLVLVVVAVYQSVQVVRMYNQQRVITRFREERSRVLLLLTDDLLYHQQLSAADRDILKMLYQRMQVYCVEFDRVRRRFFTLRNYYLLTTLAIQERQKHQQRPPVEHPLVANEHARAGQSVLFAFSVLVPLFRFRLVYGLFALVVRLLVFIGVKRLSRLQQQLSTNSQLNAELRLAAEQSD